MRIKVKVDGVSSVVGKLEGYEQSVLTGIIKQTKISAFKIESRAKVRCPVDTGRLRSSINTQIQNGGTAAEIRTNVMYSKFVEFGTSKMSAQPFLFPSWAEEKETYKVAIRSIVKG